MNTYTLFWLTGKSELVKGDDIAQAMTLAGYSQGAVAALDFHSKGDIREDYHWVKEKRTWESTPCTGCLKPKFMCQCHIGSDQIDIEYINSHPFIKSLKEP